MEIEHEGSIYETNITKPILEGDLYYDCMVHNRPNVVRALEQEISIDDFGVGFTSISNFRNKDISAIKIDKSLSPPTPHTSQAHHHWTS